MKGEDCFKAIVSAMRVGFMDLDTDTLYGNDKEVGLTAVMERGLDRKKLFIQTLCWSCKKCKTLM